MLLHDGKSDNNDRRTRYRKPPAALPVAFCIPSGAVGYPTGQRRVTQQLLTYLEAIVPSRVQVGVQAPVWMQVCVKGAPPLTDPDSSGVMVCFFNFKAGRASLAFFMLLWFGDYVSNILKFILCHSRQLFILLINDVAGGRKHFLPLNE